MSGAGDLAAVVARVRAAVGGSFHDWSRIEAEDVLALCAAAEQSEKLRGELRVTCDTAERLRQEHFFCELFQVQVDEWKQALRERDEARAEREELADLLEAFLCKKGSALGREKRAKALLKRCGRKKWNSPAL